MERDVQSAGDDAAAPPDGLALARRLRALGRAERDLATALARELGVGPTDLIALGDLLTGEPVGPTELGRRLGLGSAAATVLADRLEAAGHVERRPHPGDRRRLVVAPTEHAREAFFARVAPLGGELGEIAARFTPSERDAIGRFLDEVLAVYAAHTRPR